MTIKKIAEQIKKAERILLLTHASPDGDALGSLLGFKHALDLLNKKVGAVCPDKIPSAFLFLPDVNIVQHDFLLGDYDLIFILDCGDLKRTGFAQRLKEFTRAKNKIINIDHHPKNDVHRLARYNLVDYSASSTSEIVFNLLKHLKIPFNRPIATSLLCGIYTDTGAFQHSNTTPRVLRIASELLRFGARIKDITRNITNGKTVAALKLWGIVFSRIQTNKRLGLATSYITLEDIARCRATQNDLAGVVNMINAIPDADVSILFSEREDGEIKASLRTEKNNVDLSRLAAIFGGGGLKKASGFTISGKLVKNSNGWAIR